jgi:heme oxygenase (mycobilin-producing)
MVGHVRVLLYASAPTEAPAAVWDVYHQISQRLVGTPGLLNSELMQAAAGSDDFIVMSEWSSMDAFRLWEEGPDHTTTTAPLRPYHDRHRGYGSAFGIYTVTAEYRGPAIEKG